MVPQYSNKALEAKNILYGKPIVYVEGIDDIPFWNEYFQKKKYKVKLQSVNGCNQLKEYINKVHNGTNILIAMDRDYNDFLTQSRIYHDHIILTPTHSIENIIFCKKRAQKLFELTNTENSAQLLKKFYAELEKFKTNYIKLVCLDILNMKYEKSLNVLDSFHRIKNPTDEYNNLITHFTNEELQEIDILSPIIEKNFWGIIRGHFLESFIYKTMRTLIKKDKQFSNDSFRVHFTECTCTRKCGFAKKTLEEIDVKFKNFTQQAKRKR